MQEKMVTAQHFMSNSVSFQSVQVIFFKTRLLSTFTAKNSEEKKKVFREIVNAKFRNHS